LDEKTIEPPDKASGKPSGFEPGDVVYAGPRDGLSRAPKKGILGVAIRGFLSLCFRTDVHGRERLPQDGSHLYCPNHASMADVPSVLILPMGDMRLMLNIEAFSSSAGSYCMTRLGAFPVNRTAPSPVTRKHCVDVLKSGSSLCLFPEGGFQFIPSPDHIGPFFKGAAAAAILGEADAVVPIGIHYGPDTKTRTLERLLGLCVALCLSAAVLLAPVAWQPGLLGLGFGALGAVLGAWIGRKLAAEREYWNPFPGDLRRLGGGILGLIGGAILGSLWVPQQGIGEMALSAACGLGVLGIATWWRRRLVQTIQIGEPLDVGAFIERAVEDRRGAVAELTRVLHREVGQLKAGLSGVAYDESAEAIATDRPVPSVYAVVPEQR